MKTIWSFTLLLLLWGTSAAAHCFYEWPSSLSGVLLPAWTEAQAPLTLEVRLDTLPPVSYVPNPFSLCLVFVMTDGQDLVVMLQGQRYPRSSGAVPC